MLCNRLFLLGDTTLESERQHIPIKLNMSEASYEESDLDEKVMTVCKHADKSGSHDETGEFKNKY